jgi:hypothetical protein
VAVEGQGVAAVEGQGGAVGTVQLTVATIEVHTALDKDKFFG